MLPPSRLIGTWRLLRADPALDFAPDVQMEFRADGELRYSFAVGSNRQVVSLRYHVEGSTLQTIMSGTTHHVAAAFEFGPADVLVFDFGGARAWLVRELGPPARGNG